MEMLKRDSASFYYKLFFVVSEISTGIEIYWKTAILGPFWDYQIFTK